MCACDEQVGTRFLAQQLHEACELDTQRRVPVTMAFQPATCSECRGGPADHAPKAASHGRTSGIKRYYWRELYFDGLLAKADWDLRFPSAGVAERAAAHADIEAQVLKDTKLRHAEAPKYSFSEPSQQAVIDRYRVEVEALSGEYAPKGSKGAQILVGGAVLSPEAFSSRHYEALGWSAIELESVPFHALFGTMMLPVIQDTSDPLVQMVSFGDRAAFEATGANMPVVTQLPEDFGTKGYGLRRAGAIDAHLDGLPRQPDALLAVFDHWRLSGTDLRGYLWAHRDEQVERARLLVEILPPDVIITILRYLAGDYWGRHLGWPDLLLHRVGAFRLVEVKSSSDKLSDQQKRWIADNHDHLHLPFAIAKIHRLPVTTAASTSGR